MIRQTIFITDLILSVIALVIHLQNGDDNAQSLEEVATFEKHQPTGIAVSNTGRVFVNFPLWSDQHKYSVVEIMPDGSTQPFPNERWNAWDESTLGASPVDTFVSVQSVWVDDQNMLWVLDPASPRMEGVVPGGPKLIKVNLSTNQVERVVSFDEDVAPHKSYLNDVRVDTERNYAYITESGLGAIIAVNLETGNARRLLHDHPSTKAEQDVTLTVEGKQVRDEQGRAPQIHADGIALSSDGQHLYYHALTGKTLYRVPTEALRDESLSTEDLAQRVEKVAETVVTDGMLMDEAGNVYHTALEKNAIVRLTPEKKLETVVQDERISWPDSMALYMGNNGKATLYFTTSQIHHMPRFNNGESTRTQPYRVFKVQLPSTDSSRHATTE